MLVVDQVIPGGPAFDKLEPGDILVKMNGELVTSFNHLEDIFDSNIETDINLDVERGGTPMSLSIKVQDLHSITPDKYLEIGGGILVGFIVVVNSGSILCHINKPKISDYLWVQFTWLLKATCLAAVASNEGASSLRLGKLSRPQSRC